MPQAQKGAELWLFTMRFPFGTGEAFLEHELPFLATHFQRVLLFPLEADGDPRDLPGNVEVVRPFDHLHARAGWWSLLRSLPLLLRVRRVVRRDAPTRAAFRSQWPEVRSRLRQALHREQGLRARFARRYTAGGVLLYSYWTSDWATVLGLWRCRDDRVRFISRIMGFDLFADRARDGWQALQAFHLAQAWRVFAASRAGLEHLRARHPLHADRLRLAYMATPDMGAGPWHRSAGPLRVVSCSNLFPLKRVPMLAQALAAMDRPVEWTHFGDGPDRKALRAVMERLPEAVQVHLPGAVANRQVLEHFRRQEVDLFVHPSGSEGGVPVALMEAASFGIPMVGFDVGGVPEIVVPGTSGWLLPGNAGVMELAGVLRRAEEELDDAFRGRVRSLWRERFRADLVHAAWADELERMV